MVVDPVGGVGQWLTTSCRSIARGIRLHDGAYGAVLRGSCPLETVWWWLVFLRYHAIDKLALFGDTHQVDPRRRSFLAFFFLTGNVD